MMNLIKLGSSMLALKGNKFVWTTAWASLVKKSNKT
jgi:hypothetical protein